MVFQCDFADGASDYAAADVLKVWTSGTLGSIGVSDVDGGTLVSPSLTVSLIAGGAPGEGGDCRGRIMGMRYRLTATPSGSETLFSFNSAPAGGHIARLVVNASLQLSVVVPATGTFGPNTTTPLVLNEMAIIEFGCFSSSAATGSDARIEVRVNGNQLADLTSIALGGSVSNTMNANGTNGSRDIQLITLSETAVADECDWIWSAWDSVVWTSANWLGVVRKITRRPLAGTAGNGFYVSGTNWTFFGGATIPDSVRETLMDSDTTYAIGPNEAGTAADRYSVKCEAMPSNTALVKLASHRAWIRKAGGGFTNQLEKFVYASIGATTHDGTNVGTPGSTYSESFFGDQGNYLTHPNGAALTKALVDTMELGLRTVLADASDGVRCSNQNLFILYTESLDPPGPYFDSENGCPIGSSFQPGLVRGQGVCS